jgi:hypothetical protein
MTRWSICCYTSVTPLPGTLLSGLLGEAASEQQEKQVRAINPAELQRSIERVLNDLWSKSARRE